MNTKRKDTNIKLNYTIKFLVFFGLILVLFSALPTGARAAEKLVLTITPPLFQLNIGPGEFWASSVKIVNTNPYDLTLYASTMNFEASGEGGQGKFTPVVKSDPEAASSTLAGWIEIELGPFFVPREKSVEVPFSVRIPRDAPPGGHYAAILVGTQPSLEAVEGASIQISSLVSSLLFVSIKGDVTERGEIREFLTERIFYQKPEVAFALRFENKGNVHLQPQGDITIYNMWGKERGKIPINQKTDFGNVLPKNIRKFVFEWQGEGSFLEVGRYKAVATLSYGKGARQNVSSATSFWVLPLAPVAGILGGFALFILVTILAIRAYIGRSLAMYQEKFGVRPQGAKIPAKTFVEPVREGVLDLRDVVRIRRTSEVQHPTPGSQKFGVGIFRFLKIYRSFFYYLAFFVFTFVAILFYLRAVRVPERSFDVTVRGASGEKINISSEEIIREKIIGESGTMKSKSFEATIVPKIEPTSNETKSEKPSITAEQPIAIIKVLNGSGIPGQAARVSILLEEKGFDVLAPANAKRFGYGETVIQYKKGKEEAAMLIRELLSDAGVLEEVELKDADILIIVGKDIQ